MKSFREFLNEKEKGKNYKDFFKEKLKKYSVESPDELSDEDKKKFFDEIDAEWEGEGELDEAKKLIVNKQQIEWFIDLVEEADSIDSLLGDLKIMKNIAK